MDKITVVVEKSKIKIAGLQFEPDTPLVRVDACHCGCKVVAGIAMRMGRPGAFHAASTEDGCEVGTTLGLKPGTYRGKYDDQQNVLFILEPLPQAS